MSGLILPFTPRESRESMKAQVSATTKDLLNGLIKEICGDPVALAEAVGGGAYHFRVGLLRAYRGLPVNDEIANRIFAFLEYRFTLANPVQTAAQVLDKVELPSPPTEKEIDDAWVHEVASSDGAKRTFSSRDGRDKYSA